VAVLLASCSGDDDDDPAPRPDASAAGCERVTTETRGEVDRGHVGPDEQVDYRSNPPTLGQHWPPELVAQDGLYERAPADEALVHSMEHGRVVYWVNPSLPADAQDAMRELFEQDSYKLLMVPRRDMPYAVAATAWNAQPEPGGTGRTLGCPRWNDAVPAALQAFSDEHRDNGPELIP
jgi:hypothetical protein